MFAKEMQQLGSASAAKKRLRKKKKKKKMKKLREECAADAQLLMLMPTVPTVPMPMPSIPRTAALPPAPDAFPAMVAILPPMAAPSAAIARDDKPWLTEAAWIQTDLAVALYRLQGHWTPPPGVAAFAPARSTARTPLAALDGAQLARWIDTQPPLGVFRAAVAARSGAWLAALRDSDVAALECDARGYQRKALLRARDAALRSGGVYEVDVAPLAAPLSQRDFTALPSADIFCGRGAAMRALWAGVDAVAPSRAEDECSSGVLVLRTARASAGAGDGARDGAACSSRTATSALVVKMSPTYLEEEAVGVGVALALGLPCARARIVRGGSGALLLELLERGTATEALTARGEAAHLAAAIARVCALRRPQLRGAPGNTASDSCVASYSTGARRTLTDGRRALCLLIPHVRASSAPPRLLTFTYALHLTPRSRTCALLRSSDGGVPTDCTHSVRTGPQVLPERDGGGVVAARVAVPQRAGVASHGVRARGNLATITRSSALRGGVRPDYGCGASPPARAWERRRLGCLHRQ